MKPKISCELPVIVVFSGYSTPPSKNNSVGSCNDLGKLLLSTCCTSSIATGSSIKTNTQAPVMLVRESSVCRSEFIQIRNQKPRT